VILAAVLARFLLGVTFGAAAVAKVRDSGALRGFLRASHVPDRAIGPLVAATVAAEAATAGLLLAYPRIGFPLALLMLAAFSALLGRALRRPVRVPCGCFGRSATPVGAEHLIRNAVLAAVAVTGLVGTLAAAPAPLSGGTVAWAAVGVALALAVVGLDDLKALLSNEHRENL
jgi:hypothetical protein